MNLRSPYESNRQWLKGNLHTHSTVSDGSASISSVIEEYARQDFDFLVTTEHDTLVDIESYREETSMVLLSGNEVTANGPHILHVGASRQVTPHGDRQAVLDDIADGEGIGIMAHPNWGTDGVHCPLDRLQALRGYHGIEIYNGETKLAAGLADATDVWDRLLAAGRQVWGYGADDSHSSEGVGLAWTMVQVEEASPDAILDSLQAGRCYASTGPMIDKIDISETIRIEAEDAERIRVITDYGAVRAEVAGSTAEFDVPGGLNESANLPVTYARFECIQRDGGTAWTQPVFV